MSKRSYRVFVADNHGRNVEYKSRAESVTEALFNVYLVALEEKGELLPYVELENSSAKH